LGLLGAYLEDGARGDCVRKGGWVRVHLSHKMLYATDLELG
jgi:hypothetical protein